MEETRNHQKNGYGGRPLWQWIVLYVIIGLIVYGIIYYFIFQNKNNGRYTGVPNEGNTNTSVQQQNPNQNQSQSQTEINISGNEFAFTPSNITVRKGQPAKITFKNAGKYPHNLVVSDLNLQTKTIQPGEEDSITFTPDKTGSFEFICTVPGHADRGMKGTLTVQ